MLVLEALKAFDEDGCCDQRFFHLTTTLIDWLICHEVGHIAGGHLGLLKQLKEVGEAPHPSLDPLFFHAVEYDADIFANSFCFGYELEKYSFAQRSDEEIENLLPGQSAIIKAHYSSLDDIIVNYLAAVYWLFRLFGVARSESAFKSVGSHPHSAHRFFQVVFTCEHLLKSEQVETQKAYTLLVAEALAMCERAVQEYLPNDNGWEFVLETLEGNDVHRKILDQAMTTLSKLKASDLSEHVWK